MIPVRGLWLAPADNILNSIRSVASYTFVTQSLYSLLWVSPAYSVRWTTSPHVSVSSSIAIYNVVPSQYRTWDKFYLVYMSLVWGNIDQSFLCVGVLKQLLFFWSAGVNKSCMLSSYCVLNLPFKVYLHKFPDLQYLSLFSWNVLGWKSHWYLIWSLKENNILYGWTWCIDYL